MKAIRDNLYSALVIIGMICWVDLILYFLK